MTDDEQFWRDVDKTIKTKVVKPKTCDDCRKVLQGRYFENDDGETFCVDCVEEAGYDV